MEGPVLYLTPQIPDYLSVSLLHGLRSVRGSDVIDWPRYNCAYENVDKRLRENIYGRGFTAFFHLPDVNLDRSRIIEKVASGFFKLIIFSDIWSQGECFAKLLPHLRPESTVLIDGQDSDQVVPHAGNWWRRPAAWWRIRATRNFSYYKREWTHNSHFNIWHRALPQYLRERLAFSQHLNEISFSIPEAKIVKYPPEKRQDFPKHIVDAEVASVVNDAYTSYAFSTEEDYYRDLRNSRFGITTKRAGWDCMRHYEIAANGAVPCFRRLREKPTKCAPHGLVADRNCLDYWDAKDLLRQVAECGPEKYTRLQFGALEWVMGHSTVREAQKFLASLPQPARVKR